MSTPLTNSLVPSSPDELRLREAMAACSYTTLPGLAADVGMTVPETAAMMETLTLQPHSLYTAHAVQLVGGDNRQEVVYTFSAMGVSAVSKSPAVISLVASRISQFSGAPTECRTISAQEHTATTLSNYFAYAALANPRLTLRFAGTGDDSTAVLLARPIATSRAHAVVRMTDARGVVYDLALYTAHSPTEVLAAAGALCADYDASVTLGTAKQTILIGWASDPSLEPCFWVQCDSWHRAPLRQQLRTTCADLVCVDGSSLVAAVSPRRFALALSGPVFHTDATMRRPSDPPGPLLPRCRLEVFDCDAEIPQ